MSAAPTLEDPFELTIDNLKKWLLEPYDKQRQVLEDAKKKVRQNETSIDSKVLDELLENNLAYNEGSIERRHKVIIRLATNPRTNRLWDIPTLQNSGRLGDAEADYIRTYYGGKEPPFWYVTQIERRVDKSNKEWLVVHGMIELLDKNAQRLNKSFRLGFYNIPKLQWKPVPINPRDPDSEQTRIPQHSWQHFYPEDSGLRIYDLPYSKDTFFALMKHARTQQQDPTDKNTGVSLTFYKIGTPNPITVPTIEQFTTNNFQEEWVKLNAPPAAKDLENFVKEFRKQSAAQDTKAQTDFLREFVTEFRRQSISEAENNAEHYK